MGRISNTLLTTCCTLYVAILLSGCKKLIAVDPPKTQQVTESVFQEKYTAIAAITGIYGKMSSMTSLSIKTGLSSDEFINYGGETYQSLYVNALTDKNGLSLPWGEAYNYIYQANAAIEGLQASSRVSTLIKNQLLGEAKFIRAFWYYYLTNLYGDLPLVLTTDYRVTIRLARSPQSDIYLQIIADLKEAQLLMGDDYMDAQNAPTTERVRPTKWVATAFLARAYLRSGNYRDAEIQATAVIGHTGTFQLCNDLNVVFLKNSTETIWQLMPPANSYYETSEGGTFILNTAPSPGTGVSVSSQLLNAFEAGDKRRENWIDSIIVAGKTYYFPYKNKIQFTSGDHKEYSMVLRLAEQFLIRSEARAQLNNLYGAFADLDSVRIRAGLKPTTATTKTELLNAILHERQVELFAEGHRWMDLRASGKLEQVMKIVTPEKGGGNWQNYQQLYPLAIEDIQTSTQLKQNPGY